jgi:hypothetical protein
MQRVVVAQIAVVQELWAGRVSEETVVAPANAPML